MRLFFLICLFAILSIYASAKTTEKVADASEAPPKVAKSSRTKNTEQLSFVDRARLSVTSFFDKVKRFFSGDVQLSTEMFGKKISFRTNIPDTKEEASKSIARFFSNVISDSATRIVFVIYLNLVVMFVTYTLFFIKQMQLHRRQKQDEKFARKQRKIDEEERRWMVHGELNPDEVPVLSTVGSMATLPKETNFFEDPRSICADNGSVFEQVVRDLDNDSVSLDLDRTLHDELEYPSPTSNRSVRNHEIPVQAEVYAAPKDEESQ